MSLGTVYTKDATGIIGVNVLGEWLKDKFYCRTIEESPRVVIRTAEQLAGTKAKATKVKL